MKHGLHADGRKCGPIDPAKVNETGWTWYDTAEARDASYIPTKAELRTYANAKRDSVEQGGFLHNASPFDSGPVSVARLTGATVAAQAALDAGQPFQITWTGADNAEHVLDAAGLIALHQSLVMHANACHQKAKQIKADIDAGTITKEAEIDAAGWL